MIYNIIDKLILNKQKKETTNKQLINKPQITLQNIQSLHERRLITWFLIQKLPC